MNVVNSPSFETRNTSQEPSDSGGAQGVAGAFGIAGSAFSAFVERFTRRGEPERQNMDRQTNADANALRRDDSAQARDARKDDDSRPETVRNNDTQRYVGRRTRPGTHTTSRGETPHEAPHADATQLRHARDNSDATRDVAATKETTVDVAQSTPGAVAGDPAGSPADTAGPTSEAVRDAEAVGDVGMSINAAQAAVGARLDEMSAAQAASDATTQDETPTATAAHSTSNTDTESLVGAGLASSSGSKGESAVQAAALANIAGVNSTEANGSEANGSEANGFENAGRAKSSNPAASVIADFGADAPSSEEVVAIPRSSPAATAATAAAFAGPTADVAANAAVRAVTTGVQNPAVSLAESGAKSVVPGVGSADAAAIAAAVGAARANSVAGSTTVGSVATPPPAPPAPVTQQLVSVIAPFRRQTDGSYQLAIELHPRELGRVEIELAVRNGVITLHMRAEHGATNALLRDMLGELARDLELAGIRTDSLTVAHDMDRNLTNSQRDQQGLPSKTPDRFDARSNTGTINEVLATTNSNTGGPTAASAVSALDVRL